MEKDKTEDPGKIEVAEAEEVQEDKEDLEDKEQIKLDLGLGKNSTTGIAKFARNVDITHYFSAQNSQNMFPEETM